ncbi:MAG: hypothetical protein ACE37M_06620 [Henriciella sp.]
MDPSDIDLEEKNLVGNIDRAIISFGLVCLAIVPTYFYLVFRPKELVPLLKGKEPDARSGLKLGPGITFVFSILLLLAFGYVFRDIVAISTAETSSTGGSGIRSAVADGNLWRSIILSLPLYFAALLLGVIIKLAHMIARKPADLAQTIAAGLYSLSTLFVLVIPVGMSSEYLQHEDYRANVIVASVVLAFFVILPWQIFSFSKHGFGTSTRSAIAIAALSLFLSLVAMAGFGASLAALSA